MLKQLACISAVLSLYLAVCAAVTCKLCVGSMQSDCAKNSAESMALVECNSIGEAFGNGHHRRHAYHTTMSPNGLEDESTDKPTQRWQAACMYIKTKDSNATSALIARGCSFMRPGKDWCRFMEKRSKDIVECKTCNSDECN